MAKKFNLKKKVVASMMIILATRYIKKWAAQS